jgi:adenylate cyclase
MMTSYRAPVNADGAVLVPFQGLRASLPITRSQCFQRALEVSPLKGKIVLVGATAPGVSDSRGTLVYAVYPGVEIHANLIAGMIDRNSKYKSPYAMGAEFTIVLLIGVAFTYQSK